MTGPPYMIRPMFGLRGPKQQILGSDVAGRVAAVEAGVRSVTLGDEVFGTADGSFAEFAVTMPDRITRTPSNISPLQAATVATSGAAALQALRDKGQVTAGDSVLVIGASGGVGSFAVQLAKAFGAHVTGVASTTKRDDATTVPVDVHRAAVPTRAANRSPAAVPMPGSRCWWVCTRSSSAATASALPRSWPMGCQRRRY